MTDISEETKSKTRAKRRKTDWKKAIRKSKIVKLFYRWPEGYYEHLHEYSKGKIHCSCPMCAAKTNPKRKKIETGYSLHDQKRIDEMNDAKEDTE